MLTVFFCENQVTMYGDTLDKAEVGAALFVVEPRRYLQDGALAYALENLVRRQQASATYYDNYTVYTATAHDIVQVLPLW